MRRSKLLSITAGVLASGLFLAGCGDDGEEDTAGTDNGTTEEDGTTEDESDGEGEDAGDGEASGEMDWGNCDPTEGGAAMPDPEGTGEDADTDLTLGIFQGWDESYATGYLVAALLEEQGYSVEFTELEAGVTYEGVATGDIDFTTDGWLPLTHADYLDQHGEDMVSLGCWYDNAKLTIAVNEDAPVQSLAELNENADAFEGELFGIEPGAGLTQTTQDEVIPTYGLDDFEFLISSTPAMLTELREHTNAGENVVVTLWRPHWAYDAFPIRDLEDPEGALGGTEFLYSFGRAGFDEDNPNASQLVRNLVMTDEELASLENLMFSEEHYNGEDHEAAVADWIEENPEFVENLRQGAL